MSFLSVPISIQTLFGQGRKIADIDVNVVLNESATDNLTITKQPVQQGANITDHSFKEPTDFSTSILFRYNSSKSLAQIYQTLLDLQSSRAPFTITTPKRVYKSMLISALRQDTDKGTENCLAIHLTCQEVIIVNVTAVTVPKLRQKAPKKTQATQNTGKKSGLETLYEIPSYLRANVL